MRGSFAAAVVFLLSCACFASPLGAQPAGPLLVMSGDGMIVRILSMSEDEARVTGELTLDGQSYPFTARLVAEDEDEEEYAYQGAYRAGAETRAFAAVESDDGELLTLTTGGRRYRLREVSAEDVAPAPPPSAPREPTTAAPADAPAQVRPAPQASAEGGAGLPDAVKLRKVEFRDVNMNNVVAYTMLVPDGWQAEGHIEWSQDRTPYPQRKITITGPGGCGISFVPNMPFSYSESTPLARQESAAMGMRSPIPDQSGVAPPEDLGTWLAAFLNENNPQVRNVELVSDERDETAEAAMAEQQRALGAGTTWEVHLITIRYEKDGVPFSEQIHANYGRNPVIETRNINMMTWMLAVNAAVRAPADEFERLKPLLYASASSLRPVPQWWTQQQLLIMEITRQNHVIGMEEIRRRGQFYDQMSDENFAAWKRQQQAGDAAQEGRIDAIYEVERFTDTDGLPVKLPIHYQNYYSDGQGNYLLTNSTQAEPGSEWTKLEPER